MLHPQRRKHLKEVDWFNKAKTKQYYLYACAAKEQQKEALNKLKNFNERMMR